MAKVFSRYNNCNIMGDPYKCDLSTCDKPLIDNAVIGKCYPGKAPLLSYTYDLTKTDPIKVIQSNWNDPECDPTKGAKSTVDLDDANGCFSYWKMDNYWMNVTKD